MGLRRIFHLETADDPGLGRLTGGRRAWSRHAYGAWLRAVPAAGVTRFLRQSAPRPHRGPGRGGVVRVSLDEHAVPRWTRKFAIPKGYHTTRNKQMKVEKLFAGFDVRGRQFLRLWATRGDVDDVELYQVARRLAQRLRRMGGTARLRLLLDAGAAKADATIAALLRRTPGVAVLLRAPRQPARLRRWQALPARAFRTHWEPGPFTGAPRKRLRVAETRTPLKGDGSPQHGVRTIVAVEGPAGTRRKERWHILYVNDERTPAYALIQEFRQRQHHEQGYRIGVHDLDLDTVPSGYDKRSHPPRPAFRPAALTWAAWTKLLAANLTEALGAQLGGPWRHAHPRTLRRTFLNRPGTLRETREALLVELDGFLEQEALRPLVDTLNAAQIQLPGPGGRYRRLFLALADERQR